MFFTGGLLLLSTDGMLRWGSKNWPYLGLIFAEKVTLNGTEISYFSQNFLLFSQISKKCTLRRDWFLYFGIFAILPGTRENEKKYPDQRIIPVPLFAQVTHRGFFIDLILCNASIRTRKIGFTLTNLCCIIFILGYWRDITKLCFPINCCR